jgi:hypothetical protein
MSLAVKVLSQFKEAQWKGLIPDMSDADTHVKCCLTTDAHTPVQNTDASYGDIVSYEITGTNYTAGGVIVTGKEITRIARDTYLKCDAPTWNTATFTARWAWFYYSDPADDADKVLIAYVDLESNQAVVAGTFSLQVDALGLIVDEAAA